MFCKGIEEAILFNLLIMKQIIYVYFLINLFMVSCTRQESSGDIFKDVPIVIDMDSVKMELHLKFEHIRYIPLETSDECLIGSVDKTLIKNDKIYVADFHVAEAIFVFDMNGKFLFKIARKGQGPGEYISFRDFDIQSNGDIYVFNPFQKMILIYNSIGEYQHYIQLDYYITKFCLVDNKMYWSEIYDAGITFAKLAVYDMTDKNPQFLLKNKKFLKSSGIINFSTFSFYYSPDNITYYSPKFSEIIYSITKDGVYPAIGLKNVNMPSQEIINRWEQVEDMRERMKLLLSSNYFFENAYIYETDKYIEFQYCIGKLQNVVIYNKFSKNIRSYLSFYEETGTSAVKGSTGQEFFGIVNFDPDNKYHKEILESHEELKDWKEGDNPVIVFFNPDM
jgi:hypothetical protein